MEMEGLDETQDDFIGMEVTISIFSFQDEDGDENDLPVGATQCPGCHQVYAGVFCPNCSIQSGLARLR
jgi:hypothetical protein